MMHEFTPIAAFDAAKSGSNLSAAVLLVFCSTLLKKSLKRGTVIVGELNLGGALNLVYKAITIVELAIEKDAQSPPFVENFPTEYTTK
jgi:ATP-dependent Lon protease